MCLDMARSQSVPLQERVSSKKESLQPVNTSCRSESSNNSLVLLDNSPTPASWVGCSSSSLCHWSKMHSGHAGQECTRAIDALWAYMHTYIHTLVAQYLHTSLVWTCGHENDEISYLFVHYIIHEYIHTGTSGAILHSACLVYCSCFLSPTSTTSTTSRTSPTTSPTKSVPSVL